MPVTLMDRLPLPNLKVYTASSVMLLSVAVYYALSVTSDPNWRVNATLQRQEGMEEAGGGDMTVAPQLVEPATNGTRNITEQFVDVIAFMMQEPLCMWTLINIAYCSLALFGFLIQRLVFGQLRVSEAQRVKDKFWNYVFYKFIFVFGVINVQYMDEVLLWCSWFTLVGFLHLLGQLCKDRFEYLSSSPHSGWWAHARLLWLLAGILASSAALLAGALVWGLPAGRDTFFFMLAECVLVVVSAVHVCARYALQLREADAAGRLAYYTHLFFDSVSLVVELVHVVHMVVYSNMLVSMASLVLLMQLRHLLHELQARVRRHRLYTDLADHMSRNYPMASKEEVEKNQDNCAICWEPMKEARKLPCSHLFHNSCLCQWVQQDASCPTCRRGLAGAGSTPGAATTPGGTAAPGTPPAGTGPGADEGPMPVPPRQPNHMFHFDGSRYVSWLPSFSVEVTRVRARDPLLPSHSHLPPLAPHQIDAMARQVVSMFPQYAAAGASGAGAGAGGGSLEAVAGDLARTRSLDLTLDNILEGRLPLPAAAPTPAAPAPTPAAPAPTPAAPTASEEIIQLIDAPTENMPNAHESFHDVMSLLGESSRSGSRSRSRSRSPGRIEFGSLRVEREASLRRRKEALLGEARARYLARTHTHTHTHTHSAHNAHIDT